jgi:hypothetical protein
MYVCLVNFFAKAKARLLFVGDGNMDMIMIASHLKLNKATTVEEESYKFYAMVSISMTFPKLSLI